MTRPTIRQSDHAPLSSDHIGYVHPIEPEAAALMRRRIHEAARDEADEALLTEMVLGGAA